MWFHHTLMRMAIIKQTNNATSWQSSSAIRALVYCFLEYKLGLVLQYLLILVLKIYTTAPWSYIYILTYAYIYIYNKYILRNPLKDIYTKYVCKILCIICNSLLIIATNGKKPKCSKIVKWVDTL